MTRMKRHTVWGLTGGIGSGKSTVARYLLAHGITVLDADQIAKGLTASGGRAIPAIRELFGDQAIDASGAMDRNHMRARIFADTGAKRQLEHVIHPLIQQAMTAAITEAPTDIVVCDVPLLVESAHWRSRCQQIWVVDCLPETQIQRVIARNGFPAEQVKAIMQQQATRLQRLAAADVVIYNETLTLTELSAEVDGHLEQLAI
jgi:dephospho-CoA kinase